MNTAIPYGLAFAVLALLLWRTGYRREAEGVATMTIGFVLMVPVVAWSPHWPLWEMVIWTTIAARFHYLHMVGRFSWHITAMGYAVAGVCMAWFVKSPVSLPSWLDYWPSWAGNFLAITMAALIAGRPICDIYTACHHRISARLGGGHLRWRERSGGSGDRPRRVETGGAQAKAEG